MDKRSYSEEIGAWIQTERLALGISQAELGESCGRFRCRGFGLGAWSGYIELLLAQPAEGLLP